MNRGTVVLLFTAVFMVACGQGQSPDTVVNLPVRYVTVDLAGANAVTRHSVEKFLLSFRLAVGEYRDYFEFVHDPCNRLRTMTVPFQGGFELTVRL